MLRYISHSFSINREYTDKHFRPQVVNIAHGAIDYNYIGKLEDYENDLRHILWSAGVWKDQLTEVAAIHANASKTSHYEPSDSQLQNIYELYEDDYVAFGYSA